jgi:hypothetical protein
VIGVYGQQASGTSDPSTDYALTGGSLTYTARNSAGDAVAWSNGGKFFTAQVGGSPSSMTVSVDAGGTRFMQSMGLVVVEYSGHNVGSPVGATAQQAISAAAGSNSLTLSGAPATDSDVLGLAGVLNGSTTIGDGGAGYAELSDNYDATATFGMESQARTASTSTTYTWANVATSSEKAVLLAIEIKAAAAGNTQNRILYTQA